jgi:hypothetical protein
MFQLLLESERRHGSGIQVYNEKGQSDCDEAGPTKATRSKFQQCLVVPTMYQPTLAVRIKL